MFDLANRFRLPLITFYRHAGRGAGRPARRSAARPKRSLRNLELMARLEVPIVSCVIGEGGSGGALALGVGNVDPDAGKRLLFGITPEGCAAILWREGGPEKIAEAAAALKLGGARSFGAGRNRRNRLGSPRAGPIASPRSRSAAVGDRPVAPSESSRADWAEKFTTPARAQVLPRWAPRISAVNQRPTA